jgi:PII-like signaling protein
MRRLEGDQVLLRIFLGDSDRHGRQPLWRALLELLRQSGVAGASVFHGQAGFGATSVIHTENLLEMSGDLPVLIEVVDAQEKIDAVLPRIDTLIQASGGLITLEKAHVIRYTKGEKKV